MAGPLTSAHAVTKLPAQDLERARRFEVPVILLIVGAFTGEFAFLLFAALAGCFELALIFGVARPAMGSAFWELVFAPALS